MFESDAGVAGLSGGTVRAVAENYSWATPGDDPPAGGSEMMGSIVHGR